VAVAARAQQPTTRVPRLGWRVTGDPSSHRFSLAAFRDGLPALNSRARPVLTREFCKVATLSICWRQGISSSTAHDDPMLTEYMALKAKPVVPRRSEPTLVST
jgi:hypothetical protein